MTVIGLMVLCACTAGDDETAVVSVADETLMPISFGGLMQEEQAVTRTATPLSETATEFKVWGYKNMTYSADNYGGLQTVFPGYTVRWEAGTASTTVTNSSNWEYILPSPFEQTVKYWDWGAKAYRFFAVTGAAAANAASSAALNWRLPRRSICPVVRPGLQASVSGSMPPARQSWTRCPTSRGCGSRRATL